MSIMTKTNYLAKCDYTGCHMAYDFWGSSREGVIDDITDDEEWLCLFTRDDQPRFFCPLHMRYDAYSLCLRSTVLYDSDSPDTQPTSHALNKYYEDMGTPQPLPKRGCEDTILAMLTSEDTK